jgi:hypothetical protein
MASLQQFFDDYADALLSYSPEKIAGCYQTPLAVYSDNGIQLVSEPLDVVAFWKDGVKPYKGMDISNTSPKILSQEQLSDTMWTAKISWSNADSSGKVVSTETNFYVLSRIKDEWKIRGLILMNKAAKQSDRWSSVFKSDESDQK